MNHENLPFRAWVVHVDAIGERSAKHQLPSSIRPYRPTVPIKHLAGPTSAPKLRCYGSIKVVNVRAKLRLDLASEVIHGVHPRDQLDPARRPRLTEFVNYGLKSWKKPPLGKVIFRWKHQNGSREQNTDQHQPTREISTFQQDELYLRGSKIRP